MGDDWDDALAREASEAGELAGRGWMAGVGADLAAEAAQTRIPEFPAPCSTDEPPVTRVVERVEPAHELADFHPTTGHLHTCMRTTQIAVLTTRRPCGHPVSLNSSGDRTHVQDGTRPRRVQRSHHCRTHVLERAGRSAPGPSTCPVCQVREPIVTDPLTHAAHPVLATNLCERLVVPGESVVYDRSEPITCPDCIEWLHA